jgi:hypothetical protein
MKAINEKNEKITHDRAANNTHNNSRIRSTKTISTKETSHPKDCLM